MNSIDRCRPNVSGPIVVDAKAKQPPPIDVTSALVANASTLYRAGYTPDTAAPVSLSRIATRPRPTELRIRFDVSTNRMMAMTKTVVKTQSLVVQPLGAHDGGFQWKPSVFVTSPLLMTLPLLPPVMLAKSMPKKLSDLTIAGNASARPSVINDRYSPRMRNAGTPMTAPTSEADRTGDGQRRQERPAVVGDQDHRRVRADAEERRVADRDLARVAGDDVQPEDGDGERDAQPPNGWR